MDILTFLEVKKEMFSEPKLTCLRFSTKIMVKIISYKKWVKLQKNQHV